MTSFKENSPLVLVRRLLNHSRKRFERMSLSARAQMIYANHRFRGRRPKHLVITGCSRSGTTLLYNMIRSSSCGDIFLPDREVSASDTLDVKEPQIVTKRPLDIFRLAEIDAELSPFREMFYLVLIRDPRDLVSSKHSSIPNQYFQGFDYQFVVRPRFKSYTAPGISATADAIEGARQEVRKVFVLRYEDLCDEPEMVRELLSFATGFRLPGRFDAFHRSVVPDELRRQLNGVRPVSRADRPAWTTGSRLERVLEQLLIFPELEDLVSGWGYPPTAELLGGDARAEGGSVSAENEGAVRRGTIVAFHTDDETYSKEAERCKRRLNRLDLESDFTTIPKTKDWVESCAIKPEFLRDIRRRIRGPLLYIDVDSFVHRDPWPYLSGYDADIAAYIHTDGSLASCSLLLADTDATDELLEAWVERQRSLPRTYDQRVLQTIIEEDERGAGRYRVQRLPVNFALISDRKYPYVFGEPIIEQFQASRIAKFGSRGSTVDARIEHVEKMLNASPKEQQGS